MDLSSHLIMEKADGLIKLWRATMTNEYIPLSLSVGGVKSLGQVDEHRDRGSAQGIFTVPASL